jgi:acetyltransferase
MALIAVKQNGAGEEQVGVARYVTNLDKTSCEFALAVSDKWQNKGIARRLMRNLMEIARDRDLEKMEGKVLSNNSKMLELMTSLNFQISNDPEDAAVRLVEVKLHKLN